MKSILTIIFSIILAGIPLGLKGQARDSISSLEVEAVYSALPWYNSKGGLKSDLIYLDNLDLTAKINFDRIFKFKDRLSLFIYGLRNNGERATDLMGDFQVASNIEAINSWRIFELFIQHNFFKNRISILAGLYDLNSEFDVLRPATSFINSSFGIGADYAQAGKNGPSIFPVSSLGVRFATILGKRTRIRFAMFDGVPGDPQNPKSNTIRLSKEEGALISGEVSIYTGSAFIVSENKIERSYETRRRKVGREFVVSKNDKINIGSWYFTSDFPMIGDSLTMDNRNFGVYVGLQKYFQLNKKGDYISLFARFGLANPRFNRLGSALSGGVVVSNPITNLQDSFGLAFSSAMNGDDFLKARDGLKKAETALEFTYLLPIKSWLLLQPDIQYIINPSTQVDLANSLSYAMLIQISIGN